MRSKGIRIAAVLTALTLTACSKPSEPVITEVTDTSVDLNASDRPPPPPITPELHFRDITAWAGLDIVGNATATGASFLDYDSDGDLDVLLPADSGIALMRNRGNGSFERLNTTVFEVPLVYTYALDLDYDAKSDVLVIDELGAIAYKFQGETLVARRDILFIEDMTLLPAVATIGDFAGIGRHDIILGRSFVKIEGQGEPDPNGPLPDEEPAHDVHLRWDGSSYKDVTTDTGASSTQVNTLSAMTCDLNSDGRLDLIIGTQHDEPDRYLAMNSKGQFEDIGDELGITSDALKARVGTSAMGFDAADIDGDLDLDLFVTDDSPAYGSRLYRQDADGTFTYITDQAGLGDTRNLVSWGNALADFNHDGSLDLFIANGRRFLPENVSSPDQENALYLGNGDGTFQRATSQAGSGLEVVRQSFGAIFGDIDGDGDLDVLISNASERPTLLRNDMGGQGHWLQISLNHPTLTPAVESVVTISTTDGKQRRWLHGTPSFGGSSQSEIHFGLGLATLVEAIEVQWPDSTVSTHGPYNADQTVTIKYGDGGSR